MQSMLRQTQALEDRLLQLNGERNELEAESARMPTHTTGRTQQVGALAGLTWAGGRAMRHCSAHKCSQPVRWRALVRACSRALTLRPSTCATMTLQERRRRAEVEGRLEEINKECSSIRLQLRRLGVK